MSWLLNPHRFGAGLVVYDTFTDTNGTLLTAHTPEIDAEGGGWAHRSGTFDIQSNQATSLTVAAGEPYAIATIDAGVSDCIIEALTELTATAVNRVIFRYVDNNNFWLAQSQLSGTWVYQLYRRSSGSYTLMDSSSIGTPSEGFYQQIITLSGSSIGAELVGITTVSASSSAHQTATHHGIGSRQSGQLHDDFLIANL